MLNEEQINRLYKFCVQHYVRYYDVQIELVDHLANAVEAKMEADKNLDFEAALNSVYKGFGVMGFSKIITEKTLAAERQIRKMRWQYFKEYFTIPKIAVTILIETILASLYYLVDKNYLWIVALAVIVLCALFGLGFVAYSIKYKEPKKELLCLKGVNSLAVFGLMFQVPSYLNIVSVFRNVSISDTFSGQPVYYFLFVVVCTGLILLSFALIKTYIEIQKKARKNYPLAFDIR